MIKISTSLHNQLVTEFIRMYGLPITSNFALSLPFWRFNLSLQLLNLYWMWSVGSSSASVCRVLKDCPASSHHQVYKVIRYVCCVCVSVWSMHVNGWMLNHGGVSFQGEVGPPGRPGFKGEDGKPVSGCQLQAMKGGGGGGGVIGLTITTMTSACT